MALLMDWTRTNAVELLGALSGFVYLFFSIKQKIWLWPAGIFNVSVYIYVFFVSGLYADMALHFIYLIISIYGWINWYLHSKQQKLYPVRHIRIKQFLLFGILTLFTVFFIALILKRYTDSEVPYCDATITAVSLAATMMVVYKYLENWLVWIVIDVFALFVYWYKGLYPTVVLYAVYSIFAVIGYWEWKKTMFFGGANSGKD